ncbi:hypothetical protein CTheo_7459 [Ceratobasidium theobromae]|uniref:Uncharacterized protein n=1 Tax=Ceratobasidium theobromae TaxID=1582974 RepID=A0A5N5QCM8_9AGAM|nr:hypothetical protein CTheo_7459 [Ceratobasidium theobromae]
MPVKTEPNILKIYNPHPIQPENFVLEPELNVKPSQGKVRALDGFVFLKDKNFVYPTSVRDEDWWTGVTAYGYAAALTGEYKWFIWAGRWDEEFPGKHIEVVQLKNLCKITKESNRHWRGGLEEILWLETSQGYSYALLEPDVAYDVDKWCSVTNSFTYLPSGGSQSSPAFTRINLGDERPTWWKSTGNKAWNHLIRALKEEEKRQNAAKKGQVSGIKRKNVPGVDTSATRRSTRRRHEDQNPPPASPPTVSSPSPRSPSVHNLPESQMGGPGHTPPPNQAHAKGKSKELQSIPTSDRPATDTEDGIQEEPEAGTADPVTQGISAIPGHSNSLSEITTTGASSIPPNTQAQSTQGSDNAILESSDGVAANEQTKKPAEELLSLESFVNAPGLSQTPVDEDLSGSTTNQPPNQPPLADQQADDAAVQPKSAHILPAVQPEPAHTLPGRPSNKSVDLPSILNSTLDIPPAEAAMALEASQAENAFVQLPENAVPNPVQQVESQAGEPSSLDERCSLQGAKE